jgi:uncharacterized protein (UPF0332 family)
MITGSDFIQLSNRWSMLPNGSGGSEAVWRTSICRAYYGTFHLAQDLLEKTGIKVPTHNAHDFVFKALKQSGNRDLEKAGRMLHELRDSRTDADYDLKIGAHGKQEKAQECHHDATTIVDLLNSVGGGDLAAVRISITKWMQLNGHPI